MPRRSQSGPIAQYAALAARSAENRLQSGSVQGPLHIDAVLPPSPALGERGRPQPATQINNNNNNETAFPPAEGERGLISKHVHCQLVHGNRYIFLLLYLVISKSPPKNNNNNQPPTYLTADIHLVSEYGRGLLRSSADRTRRLREPTTNLVIEALLLQDLVYGTVCLLVCVRSLATDNLGDI